MRISDWSSDVCSSDLLCGEGAVDLIGEQPVDIEHLDLIVVQRDHPRDRAGLARDRHRQRDIGDIERRSEEHTSELQSLMRISYAVLCLKKKINLNANT